MKLNEIILNIFSEGKNPSSKRVCGIFGWLVCLIGTVYGIFYEIKSPDTVEAMFWASCALLGIDSVSRVFHRKSNIINNKNTEELNDEIKH